MSGLGKLAVALAFFLVGCSRGGAGGGHDHDQHRDHPHEEAAPSLALTRWTDRYELFVELPVPVAGKVVPLHPHVTRLADFAPVTEGTFKVRFKTPTNVAREVSQPGVKHPGIFALEAVAPAAGSYNVEMVYERGGEVDVFDCGTVLVAERPAASQPEPVGSGITFVKESQWRIPFGTAWAAERLMARELEIPADIEPAAKDQLTVGAPTGGRFFHNPKLALGEGTKIRKGDVLGTIAPTVAGDDYSRLQLAVEEARLAVSQTQREVDRVEPLVRQGLLPERRVIELRNELETHTAQLKSASARLGRVNEPGGAGGVPIKSTLEGVISQVAVPNGEPVAAGAPLVRLGGTQHLWLRARFIAKPATLLAGAAPSWLRFASGDRINLENLGATFLSALPVVDPTSRVATWIVDVPAPTTGTADAASADLRPGASVVLSVRIGKPELALAVPRSAVVEINTRPYVFVQLDGEHFDKRAVTVGAADGDFVRIVSGLRVGERIAIRGGYDIHLASLLGSVDSHRH